MVEAYFAEQLHDALAALPGGKWEMRAQDFADLRSGGDYRVQRKRWILRIIATSLPRMARKSLSESCSRSRPSMDIVPASQVACGGKSCSRALASVLLPHPDSPRIPTISPRAISRLTPSSARTGATAPGA